MSPAPLYLAPGRGVRELPGLERLLGARVVARPPAHDAGTLQGVLAWGRKPSAREAERWAERLQLPLLRLEDGFVRSVDPGRAEPALSLVVDDQGIYYDASGPSRLEQLVRQPLDHAAQERARGVRALWCREQVSKYNHAPEAEVPPTDYVLVVDQTRGDASIACGLADAGSFDAMLQAALAEWPASRIVVKLHPEVMRGTKQGHFVPDALRRLPRVEVLGDDVHPTALLRAARAVYVVTSQMGFEALLWGRPVHVFGMPFYAGWGLTHDRLPAPQRRAPVALEQLVHAALIAYPRYVHPEQGEPCAVEDILAWVGLQRAARRQWPSEVWACGFSRWKRPVLRRFLPGARVHFVRRPALVPPNRPCVVWGRRDGGSRQPLLRVEDGFLRSVGLGAELVRPLSWVIDPVGIYYDATAPSRLEHLLQTGCTDAQQLERAAALRQAVLAAGLTKYNVGSGQWQRPHGRTVILVPGQVEGDLSLRYGAPEAATNAALLEAVRHANPQAWVVYKPHPDLLAGVRRGEALAPSLAGLCDEIVVDVPMGQLLMQVDEVHVLTSLAGFEALLRERRVVCYGLPFYAGWGLTDDRVAPDTAALQRRQRRLTLDELVWATLIAYPAYVSRVTGRYTTPERALQELVAWRATGERTPRWRRLFMQLMTRVRRRP